MPKHIGIVSVTYEGAALCYRSICTEAASVLGEYQHPQITIHSFPLSDYMSFFSKLDWEGVAGCCSSLPKRSNVRARTSPSVRPTRHTKPSN